MVRHPLVRAFAFTLLAAPLLWPVTLLAQNDTSAPGRIGAIDQSSRVVLRGNRSPLATAANDRGEANPGLPMERMLLVLKRSPASQSALDRLVEDQQDASSPRFHSWLTPAQFGAQFGPAPSDLQTVSEWLVSHGFRVGRIAQSGMLIEFSGTAGQVEDAFAAPIHAYLANGKTHFANSADPQIPAALAPVVAGIATLHNFEKAPAAVALGSASRIGNTSTWQPQFTFNGAAGPAHYLAPGDFSRIYSTSALYTAGTDGSGQSIAIVARSNINLSDVQIFRIAFGLPSNDPHIILDGPDPGNLLGSEETEADLDVEWAGAIAPRASINLVVSASTNSTDGVDLSALYIVDNNLSPILSASFGECEASLGQAENAFYNNLWEQAAAQGITVLVSSGDNGAAGCDNPNSGQPASQGLAVNGLASTAFNIAVGGTQFNENGADSSYWSPANGADQSSVLGYIPEIVWNESCADANQCGAVSLLATSGGASSLYAKPPWQVGTDVPADGARDLPDVAFASAAGHDGYLVCQDGICTTDGSGQLTNAYVVGGTSAATPSFAGIMALIVQQTGSRQGQANFVIYPLAAGQNAAACNATGGPGSPQAQCIFNDTTQGNNTVPGQAGYSATPSYDLATGWGSANAANLAAGWANVMFRSSITNLQISPTSVMHGQPVTATVTVAPMSGGGTPTGEVALLPGTAAALDLGPLSAGSASSSSVTLPGGSYSVTAAYGGDGVFRGSNSNSVAVTVSPEASFTAFSILGGTQSGNPPVVSTTYSAFLELQASVSGASGAGTATGTITFSDTFDGNSSTLASVPLNAQGVAIVPTGLLAIGNHSISATYSGDASFQASAAGPITINVALAPTVTFLFVPAGALPSASVTMEAIVFAQTGSAYPTGTVQFYSGGTALGSPVPVKNLLAVLATTQLAAGANSITASYSGDANFLSSSSTASTVYVGNPDFQIAANPGIVFVSAGTPGASNLVLSPGPGLGYAGAVTFTCSGLPSGVSCSFVPPVLALDGSTTTTDRVTFSKSAGATAFPTPDAGRPLAVLSLACFLLLLWPRTRRVSRALACVVLLAAIACASACGGRGSSVTTTPPPSGATTTVVTITAAGAGVSHSVSLALTVQ